MAYRLTFILNCEWVVLDCETRKCSVPKIPTRIDHRKKKSGPTDWPALQLAKPNSVLKCVLLCCPKEAILG